MTHDSTSVEKFSRQLTKAILVGGAVAGTLDIIAAIVQTLANGRDPINMLQFIASGVFGREALQGSAAYALLGLFFHYCIATGWSALLFWIYPRIGFFSRNWILTGLLYGFFVWLMMNRVVLPLSNTPPLPFTIGWNLLKPMIIIIVAVGLPLAYLARKYYSSKN